MRILACAALLFAVAFAPRPAAAEYNLPWCATYYDMESITSCAFTSYEQCFATVGGPVGGHCTWNPANPPRTPYAESHRAKRRISRTH
jgi:hypothetical protein